MKALKIGLVLDDSLDTPDGVQQYVLSIGTWLSAQGHDVHYLVGATSRTDVANVHSLSRNFKVRFNGNRLSIPLPAGRAKLREFLQTHNFDVLHVQMPYSPWLAHRIIKLAPEHTAIVGTFHILPYSRAVLAANRALAIRLRPTLKRFDAIFAVSVAAKKFAERVYKIRCSVLPNVIDEARFRKSRPFPRFGGDELTIAFLGRLVPRKGCKRLLEAIHILSDQNDVPRFRVLIGGKGPLAAELKQYVIDKKLEHVVEFTGFVAESDKPDFLASADIAVFPSSAGESFGIVLLEAMTAGHAVVLAGDNPGYRSVLGEKPELLFPADKPDALADKLVSLLGDAASRTEIVAWQKKFVQQFDVGVVGEKLVAAYRQCCEKRSK